MNRQEIAEKLNLALKLIDEVREAHIDDLPAAFKEPEFYPQLFKAKTAIEELINDLNDGTDIESIYVTAGEDFSNVYETDDGEGR